MDYNTAAILTALNDLTDKNPTSFEPMLSQLKTGRYENFTTVGSDVLDPYMIITRMTSGGAHGVTLADGKTGAIKFIVAAAVAAGNITLTPANLADGTTIVFDAALEFAVLYFDGSNWVVLVTNATVS